MVDSNKYKYNDRFDFQEISFYDILRIILFYKWIIIAFTSISLLISIYISWTTIPEYKARTQILIDKQSTAESFFDFSMDDQNYIVDELGIIRSRTLAESVIDDLWENLDFVNNSYLFNTRKYLPKGQSYIGPVMDFFTFGNWQVSDINKKISKDDVLSYKSRQKFAKKIQNNITVQNKRGTRIIEIQFSSPNAFESARIANKIAEVYMNFDLEWAHNESIGLESFIQNQIDEKKIELSTIEKRLKEFKESNKIFGLDANSESILNQAIELETQLNNNITLININNKNIEITKESLTKEEKNLAKSLSSSISPILYNLKSELNNYETELIKNIALYGENHEAVRNIRENINILKNKINNKTDNLIKEGMSIDDPIMYRQELITKVINLESENKLLDVQLNEYSELLEKYNEKLQRLPLKQMEFSRLEREYQVLSDTYKLMREKYEEVKIATASVAGKVRVIDKAIPASSPTKPDVKRNLVLGVFFGILLSGGYIVLREFFDKTVKSIEYLDRLNVPLLAIIPAIGKASKKKRERKKKIFSVITPSKNLDKLQRRLITSESPKSPVSEAYRTLRTNLLYSSIGSDSKKVRVVVSSPGPGEGKTTTIINLAITFANLGKKTILIDADLRRPVLHKVFNESKNPGLTHCLCDNDVSYKDIIKPTEIENLSIITCGVIPPNPSELLGSSKMKDLIDNLSEEYDTILLDSPPIIAVTDAALLSKLSDHFLMVVRVGVTEKQGLNRSVLSLNNIGSNITGLVLNALDYNNSYYYSNYYYYQNYTSDSDDT